MRLRQTVKNDRVGISKLESATATRRRRERLIFKPLMLKSGIVDGEGAPRFSLHAMRHAAASLFIEQGWPPKKIQSMLGHSSITMTYDVYGHLFHDPAKDVDLMSEMERGLLAA